jgi:hypothetical protein
MAARESEMPMSAAKNTLADIGITPGYNLEAMIKGDADDNILAMNTSVNVSRAYVSGIQRISSLQRQILRTTDVINSRIETQEV